MARKREKRRQSKEQLAMAVRKHFNSLGVQENDVIVDFIHAIRHNKEKTSRLRPGDQPPAEGEKTPPAR
jgi:hypothetical protein